MMLNRGELDGARVLKPETVDRMTRNQIGDLRIAFPGNDLMGYGFGVLSEEGKDKTKDPAGVGTFSWGGALTPSSGSIPEQADRHLHLSQVCHRVPPWARRSSG